MKSVTQTARNSARAIVAVLQRWEDGTETDAKECEVLLKRIDGQWLLDDFDGKKAACQAYVRQVREKYASGEYVKYLESAEDLKEYVPDFQARVKAFYEKYGE